MANPGVFISSRGRHVPAADAVNEAGGAAYALPPAHALAQYAVTGCFNRSYYADAGSQLDRVLDLVRQVPAEFVAKAAIYARERGYMKDMPAFLVAAITSIDGALAEKVFPRVIDNGKMLRNFVQIVRSGVTGRKSLGTRPRRMVRRWLEGRSDNQIFCTSVGQTPSLADVIKMVHPRPSTESRRALYGYMIGRDHDVEKLPVLVCQFEAFKAGRGEPPDVPFEMLTALDLTTVQWTAIARRAGWHWLRMNLNTMHRHGVFGVEGMEQFVTTRLRDRSAETARVYPYQIMAAYKNACDSVPASVRNALQDAMEIAVENVPAIEGKVYVFPDVSGSMQSAITGDRKGSTSKVRCVDVAAIVAAAIVRKNPDAEVIPFEQDVVDVRLNPRDSIMTNAEKLAAVGGGGTNCAVPLELLNRRESKGDLCIYISDLESWIDSPSGYGATWGHDGVGTARAWAAFTQRNPGARAVLINLQAYETTQAPDRADVLNIGGWSDTCFDLISLFTQGKLSTGHWAGEIEKIEL